MKLFSGDHVRSRLCAEVIFFKIYIRKFSLVLSKDETCEQKGFPLDAKLDDIIEFCEKFGKTEQVSMRKTKERTFKVVFNNLYCML